MATKIGFVTYETAFAPCGGIAPVMDRLPGYVQEAAGCTTVVITPFHRSIEKTASCEKEMCLVGSVAVPLAGDVVNVNIYQYRQSWPWYFLKPDHPQLFTGRRHPYDVSASVLRRDALFFAAATACALRIIDAQCTWKLLLQDWEAAPTALALVGQTVPHQCFLTLHNSYDNGVTPEELRQVGIDPAGFSGGTILQQALSQVARPVFTVSEQFAQDLVEDYLQATILAPHLRDVLRARLIGINNGPFAGLAISEDMLKEILRGDFESLRKWKQQKRTEALTVLADVTARPDNPLWGNLKKFKRDDAPWFIMAGRDDPRQKGYDVAAAAVAAFLERGGKAKFIFFPIPADEGLRGLRFLQKLVLRFPEHVLVVPVRLREAFFAAMQGSSYGLMPSLYEPFGMAHEFYLNGTVGIGRATGGIIQQIVPLRSAAAFSESVETRVRQWHSSSAYPSGILYRETEVVGPVGEEWRKMNAAGYSLQEDGPDRIAERQQYRLFRSMAQELLNALRDGTRVVQKDSCLYYSMLAEGIRYVQRTFSWERTAQMYVRHMGIRD